MAKSEKKVDVQSIVIDGTVYVPEGSQAPAGPREVVVIDRGWIFAGDVAVADGYLTISNAVHVRSWSSIGFDGVVADPKNSNVVLKKMSNPVHVPAASVIFRIPVDSKWGL